MFSTRVISCAAFAWLAAVSFSAFAQAGKEDLPITQVTGVSVPYQSVFSDYKGYQEPEVSSWKKANQQVAETSEHANHDMSSVPGHGTSTAKKDDVNASQAAAVESSKEGSSKEGSAVRSMGGMNHGNHQGMHNMHGKEKQ